MCIILRYNKKERNFSSKVYYIEKKIKDINTIFLEFERTLFTTSFLLLKILFTNYYLNFCIVYLYT